MYQQQITGASFRTRRLSAIIFCMKLYLTLLFLMPLVLANVALAYNTSLNQPSEPYEVFFVETNIQEESEYLGELDGSPHMYEFRIEDGAKLTLTLFQSLGNESTPFSLIIVRENDNKKGVKEVGRLKGKDTNWSMYKDKVLGVKLSQSESFVTDIGAGVYRVEVSTPDNFGKYMLVVGEEPYSDGYFATLGDVRMIQKFFGHSIFSMLRSSYIYYPLGIILLIILISQTRRYYSKLKSN